MNTFEDAEREFARGNFGVAGEIWAGLEDDPDATFNAGNAFREAGDLSRSKVLFRAAIEQGVAEGYLNLAYLVEGEGDEVEAMHLLEEGAQAKDPAASVELAFRLIDTDPTRSRRLAEANLHISDVRQYAEDVLEKLANKHEQEASP